MHSKRHNSNLFKSVAETLVRNLAPSFPLMTYDTTFNEFGIHLRIYCH